MENKLIHYGVDGMHWGIRRYQNKDGTRTALGKKRERANASKTTDNSKENTGLFKRRSGLETTGMGFKKGPERTIVKDRWIEKKNKNTKDDNNKPKEKIDRERLEDMTDAERREYLAKFDIDTLSDYNRKLQREDEVRNRTQKSIEEMNMKGRSAIERMDDKSLKRYLSTLSYDTLKEYDTKLQKERDVRNKLETLEDARKAESRKEFEKTRDNLRDVASIADNSAAIARNLKNLSSNKNKKGYINPKEISKMSNEELRKEAERAKAINDYLRETNQTMQRGKNAIDWDKIGTVLGVIGTGVTIASTVTAMKNRSQNG